jgi:hypothetical protein
MMPHGITGLERVKSNLQRIVIYNKTAMFICIYNKTDKDNSTGHLYEILDFY